MKLSVCSMYKPLPVMFDVKLSESEKRLQEAYNKHDVLSHSLRDKQTVCDMLQSHVDVSSSSSSSSSSSCSS